MDAKTTDARLRTVIGNRPGDSCELRRRVRSRSEVKSPVRFLVAILNSTERSPQQGRGYLSSAAAGCLARVLFAPGCGKSREKDPREAQSLELKKELKNTRYYWETGSKPSVRSGPNFVAHQIQISTRKPLIRVPPSEETLVGRRRTTLVGIVSKKKVTRSDILFP